MPKLQTIWTLLTKLEQELKSAGLWQNDLPSQQALNSQQPFAVDTLSFTQWLQFIFITRMRYILIANEPLPNTMAILPAAEQSLECDLIHKSKLLKIIKLLDKQFN